MKINKHQQWISVDEKLPQTGTWVLGYTGKLVQMLFLDGVSPVIWLGYEGDWDLFVSHWMLLPDPPQDNTFCKWCNKETDLLGIEECDRCYGLRSRIEKDPVLAETILEAMDE